MASGRQLGSASAGAAWFAMGSLAMGSLAMGSLAMGSLGCGGSETLPARCDGPCEQPLSPVAYLEATAGIGEVELAWDVPIGAAGVMIRRSTEDFPEVPTDGEVIYDGDASSFTDTTARSFTDHYYAPFAYDDEGTFAIGLARAQAMPTFDPVASLSAAVEPGEVSLTWDLPNGAVGVELLRAEGRTEDSTAADVAVYEGPGTSFLDASVTDHEVYSYFAYSFDEDGVVHPNGVFIHVRPPGWAKVAAGHTHSLAIAKDGSLWAWGENYFSQLGVVTTDLCTYYLSGQEYETPCAGAPRQVGTSTDWTAIAAGESHSLAVRADGTLWGWGLSQNGQAGSAMNVVSTPTQIGAETTWTRAVAGSTHSMALKSDGSLWAWGNGGWGQVGVGIGAGGATPTMVAAAQPWTDIDAAIDSSMGLQADGTMWAWGRNAGHLGDGTTDDLFFPTQIGADTDWQAVAMGGGFATALREDGTLWAWGDGPGPNIASGSPVESVLPLQVGGASDWSAIVTGPGHVLALKQDGKMWGWGQSSYGQVGVGGGEEVFEPAQVGERTWITLSGGLFHSLGITAGDGMLWAWGDNVFGQLGTGNANGGWEEPHPVP